MLLPALVFACCVLVAQSQNREPKLDPVVLADAPVVPQIVVDSDGTLHFGPRTVPAAALESSEARRSYTRQMLQRAQMSAARGGLASARIVEGHAPPAAADGSKETALKIYPVEGDESQKIWGVGVTVYSPKTIPPKNRNKVLMEFEMDAEAITVASLGQFKVIKVNYRGGGPSIAGNEDIVAVYRELLKTYRPGSIGMFGASGGCTLAQTTILWLPVQKLPLPGEHLLRWIESGRCPLHHERAGRRALDSLFGAPAAGQHARATIVVRGQPIERSGVSRFRRAAHRQAGPGAGVSRATVPLALFRGVPRPIPTVMRPNHFIYVRDDAPDSFAYDVAKALDEHRGLFQVQLEPWYYDRQTVGASKVIPMYPERSSITASVATSGSRGRGANCAGANTPQTSLMPRGAHASRRTSPSRCRIRNEPEGFAKCSLSPPLLRCH